MVGQEKLKNKFKTLDQRFLLFIGKDGCGKETFARYLANKFELSFVLCDNKTINIKELLSTEQSVKTIYYLDKLDSANPAAVSALLNTTEEPNDNKIIIGGAQNIQRIPRPIVSRAEVCYFEPYTKEQLLSYKTNINKEILPFLQDPGQVNLLNETIYNFFVDNVTTATKALNWAHEGSIDNLYAFTQKYDSELFIDACIISKTLNTSKRLNDRYRDYKMDVREGANRDKAAFMFFLNALEGETIDVNS